MADTQSPDFTFTVIKLAITTVIFTVLLVLLFSFGSLTEIARNFPRYRCNPLIMPFASNFGYDATENFNYCLNNIFLTKASEIFAPIYSLLGNFTQVITLITNVTLGIRKLFSNFLFGVNNFVRSVRDKIQSVLFSIRMSFVKLNNLMGRVYGTMYAVIFMGTSAMTAGFNIADNDLVKFLFEFCFDPETLIGMFDGGKKPLKDVVIGDRLQDVNGPVYVTSLFRFNGKQTPMVQLHGVTVSKEHYVDYMGDMIPAGAHPEALTLSSISELVCLNVTGHKIRINDDIYADYDEHSDRETIRAAQRIALKACNGADGVPVDSYSLGIDPSCSVQLADGSYKLASAVTLDDMLQHAGSVLGIVYEETDDIVPICATYVTGASLVWYGKQWRRAATLLPTEAKKCITIQFITEVAGVLHLRDKNFRNLFVRDYREVPLPEMEDPYTQEFKTCGVKN